MKGHTITTETSTARVQVVARGVTLADSERALLLHETGLPTRYYLPREDVDMTRLVPTDTASHCPFKGDAVYWSAQLEDGILADVAWSYPTPIAARPEIAGLICFYNDRVDLLLGESAAVQQ